MWKSGCVLLRGVGGTHRASSWGRRWARGELVREDKGGICYRSADQKDDINEAFF